MVHDRGLPSIPRGLGRELTTYLQAVHSVLANLSGLARNSKNARAVRVSESDSLGAVRQQAYLGQGAVLTQHLATNAVTGEKMADGSVTDTKLATNAVTEKAILAGSVNQDALAPLSVATDKIQDEAVTGEKMADGSVTAEKLAANLFPTTANGTAFDGDTVNLGEWEKEPLVAITGFAIETWGTGIISAGIKNLRQEGGEWVFDAAMQFSAGMGINDESAPISGEISWVATGRANNE